jgi:hypothetical protein
MTYYKISVSTLEDTIQATDKNLTDTIISLIDKGYIISGIRETSMPDPYFGGIELDDPMHPMNDPARWD